MAALTRVLKRARFIQYFVPRRSKFEYSKKEGVPREFLTWLTADIDLSKEGINRYLAKKKWLALLEDHRFIPERHQTLGPNLATAHFLVRRGAKVKFVGRETWFRQDNHGNMYLPNRDVPGFRLEAIDATGMDITYAAFDNMIQLESLRYLNFSKCRYFNDWCMAKLYMFQDTLEFLDISGCTEVTHNGLACLHHLKKLRGLKLSHLPNVKNIGLMTILLEEVLPECTVFGIDPEQLQPPGSGQPSDSVQTIGSNGETDGAHAEQSIVENKDTGQSKHNSLKSQDKRRDVQR